MSTAKQVGDIVRPFLERHSDFVLVGRSVVMKPVRHLMRWFLIDRTSIKGYIQPSWYVSATFGPPPKYLLSVGTRMARGVGYVGDPDTRSGLLEEMALVASEILRPANLDGLSALAWKAEPVFGPGATGFCMPLIANGRFAEALPYVTQAIERVDFSVQQRLSALKRHSRLDSRPARLDAYSLEQSLEAQRSFKTLHALLLSGNPSAIAELLHKWEAAAVRAANVEHLWQPSPFPFELGTDD